MIDSSGFQEGACRVSIVFNSLVTFHVINFMVLHYKTNNCALYTVLICPGITNWVYIHAISYEGNLWHFVVLCAMKVV